MDPFDPVALVTRQPFWYPASFSIAGGAGTGVGGTTTIRISDTHYVWTAFSVTRRVDSTGVLIGGDEILGNENTGANPDPGVLLSFKESGTDRDMQFAPIDATPLFLNGSMARTLPVPKVVRRGTTLTITLSQLKNQTAGQVTYRFTMEGFHDYALVLPGDPNYAGPGVAR